jgi:hypothetical protein
MSAVEVASRHVAGEMYALYSRRRESAVRWRRDHATDSDPERLWRAFRTGALRNIAHLSPAEQRLIRAALASAERAAPFPASGP